MLHAIFKRIKGKKIILSKFNWILEWDCELAIGHNTYLFAILKKVQHKNF